MSVLHLLRILDVCCQVLLWWSAIYELNLEFYPRSSGILFGVAQLYEEIDDTEAAIGYYERVLELRPGDPTVTARLEALRGG